MKISSGSRYFRFFLGFLALAAALQLAVPFNEFWDDSFISLLYARNLHLGLGAVFAPPGTDTVSEFARVEGYSNPLWTFGLAVLFYLPGSIFFWIKLLSLFAVGVAALSAGALSRALVGKQEKIFSWLPTGLTGMLIVLNWSVVVYVKSGMETVTHLALVLLALRHSADLLGRFRPTARSLAGNVVLWSMVVLIRPEGILYVVAPGLLYLLRCRREGWKPVHVWAWSLSLLLIITIFLLWRYGFYGEWLPNTYFAKVGQAAGRLGRLRLTLSGLLYLFSFLQYQLPWVTGAAALASLFFWRHMRRDVLALVLLSACMNVLYAVFVGGDFMPLSRFLMVAGALASVLAVIPVVILVGRGRRNFRYGGLGLGVLLLALQPTLQKLPTEAKVWYVTSRPRGVSDSVWRKDWKQRLYECFSVDPVTPQFILGKWLKENLPAGTVIGSGQCGQIPYYSELETVDLRGLNDHYLARNDLDSAYLRRRGVNFLVLQLVGDPDSPGTLYQHLMEDDQFNSDFFLTHRFDGSNQHGAPVSFVMFSRKDLLPFDIREFALGLEGLPRGLDRLANAEIVQLSLTPGLVKGLEP